MKEQTENNKVFQKGDKVMFAYYDHDECRDVDGRGWVTEHDVDNHQVLIQTTRKLHWCEPEGVKLINTNQK